MIKLYNNVSNDIKIDMSKKLLHCDIRLLSNNKSGDFSFILFRDIDIIQKFIFNIIMETPIRFFILIVLLIIMIKLSLILSITVIILEIFQILLIQILSKKFFLITLKQKNINQKTFGYITEYLSNIFLIRSINFNFEDNNLTNEFNNLNNINIKLSLYNKSIQIIFSVINNLTGLIILILGMFLIYNNKLNLGVLIEFTMLSSMLYPNIDSIMKILPKFQEVKSSIQRIENNNIHIYDINKKNAIKKLFNGKDIELKKVKLILNECKIINIKENIVFKDKAINLLLGKNGTGKTSLCSIISKLNKNYEGEIYIGDININDISQDELSKHIGWVVQNYFVLSGTIYENICSFNTNLYSKEFVKERLEELNFYKYFSCFPEGIDTQVGENGFILSKGEAQKIALARIIVQRPNIIILDEPTSFLDKDTVEHIKHILTILKENSNIIMITHDNSFNNIADNICNLNNYFS